MGLSGLSGAIWGYLGLSGLLEKLLEQRMATRMAGKLENESQKHQTCVEAYRKKYGGVEDAASFLKKHWEWREEADAEAGRSNAPEPRMG